MKILLIPGHGQGDPGATGNGYKEADLTREAAKLLKAKLDNFADVTIADTNRNWFEYINNGGYFNFAQFDYVLEIHFNSIEEVEKADGLTKGVEIYITYREKSHGVETKIVEGISSIGFRNRGVKRENFKVINYVKSQGVSSALLEICFVSDLDDMRLYQSRKSDVINAIATGIINGFSLKPKYNDDINIIKNKIGLADETIEYLKAYKYGSDLIRKIANAVK